MENDTSQRLGTQAVLAILAGLLSGAISAVAVEPVGSVLENVPFLEDTLVGLLSMLGLTAGLTFGIIGAAFGGWRLGFGWRHAALWLCASIVGMSAAFYAAILSFDNAVNSFVVPYLVASPVGALILGGGIVALRPYQAKLKLMASLLVAPTIWAVGVAVALLSRVSDDALSVPWLLALFCGWQTIFLLILALWRRA
jgi:hypothetical protein